MASEIRPFAISAPGFYGLNTQDSPVDLSANFALEAINCVIDKFGRVGARKGWVKVSDANTELSTSDIEVIGEVVQNDGTKTIVCAGGGYLYKLSGSTLVTLTYGGGGVAPTINADNWQIVTLNGIAVFWQRGYDPLIYDPAVSTTTFRRLSEKSGYTGSVQQGNCAISAYGRLWNADTSADRNTVQWSDILTTQLWTAGTSGTLNLSGVWPNGGDNIVAIAAHNNSLIIFGRRQTLIYTGADDPATMKLADTLSIGCVARDSVQNTGEDIIFLSDTGVRSLARTIQEKSAPLKGLSKNVYNDLQVYITNETGDIKSGYSPEDGIYIVTFPMGSITYCFDVKALLQDGASRVTTWTHVPKAAFFASSRVFYFGEAGYLGKHYGYSDDSSSYRMTYYTTWIDFGEQIKKSIVKKILATVIGVSNQTIVFKWGYDFLTAGYSSTASIGLASTAAEYGVAEYGIAEYQLGINVNTIDVNTGGFGKVVQVGIEAEINGSQMSIQKIEVFTKAGKL